MSSSLRRGVVAAAVFALPIATLTACGAGHDAGTSQIRPDNAYAQVEDIKIQNVNVVIPQGDDSLGGVSARLFNNGDNDQTLEEITLPGTGASVELTPAEGESEIVVPAGGSIALGGEGNPAAVIEDPLGNGVAYGNAQHLVFQLSETGGIDLHARVVGDEGGFDYYADVAPTPTAEPEDAQADASQDGTESDTGDTQDGTQNDAEDGTEDDAGDGTQNDEGTDGTEGLEGEGTGGAGAEGTEGAEDAEGATGLPAGDA